MDRNLYQRRLEQALWKAETALAANTREAYLDLASFYQRKLGGRACGCVPAESCLLRDRSQPSGW